MDDAVVVLVVRSIISSSLRVMASHPKGTQSKCCASKKKSLLCTKQKPKSFNGVSLKYSQSLETKYLVYGNKQKAKSKWDFMAKTSSLLIKSP